METALQEAGTRAYMQLPLTKASGAMWPTPVFTCNLSSMVTITSAAATAAAAAAALASPASGFRSAPILRNLKRLSELHPSTPGLRLLTSAATRSITTSGAAANPSALLTSAPRAVPATLPGFGSGTAPGIWRLGGRWALTASAQAQAGPSHTGFAWRGLSQLCRTQGGAVGRSGVLSGRGAVGGVGGLRGGFRGPVLPARSPALRRMATQASAEGASAGATATAAAAGTPRGGPLSGMGMRGRLGDALRLQVAAAWQSYGRVLYTAVAVAAVFVVWRSMRIITNLFIAVNDRMAEYGIFGVAVTLVVMAALYLRWRAAINPATVYRQAMVKLNTAPGVLEVMGAPLAGSPVRAYVVTGGGVYLSKRFRLKLRSRRIQMLFPLSGRDRRGLVSLEAKRKGGKYVWKLLAVDLGPELQQALPAGGAATLSAGPPPRGPLPGETSPPPSSRVYVVGEAAAYQRSGVLGELRAPFLKALSNSRSYEVEDELEDELDELTVPQNSPSAVGAATAMAGSAVHRVREAVSAVLLSPAGAAGAKSADATTATATASAGGSEAAPSAAKVKKAPQPSMTAAPAQSSPGPVPPKTELASESAKPSAVPSSSSSSSSWWSRMGRLLSGPKAPAS